MATQRICDGCRIPLYKVGEDPALNGGVTRSTGRELVVQGVRANSTGASELLPLGEFTWCENCTKAAFRAVRDEVLRTAGWIR